MAPAVSFLLSALLASYVAAAPQPREVKSAQLGVSRRFNVKAGQRLVDADRARIQAMLSRNGNAEDPSLAGSSSSFPVTNTAVTYVASVGVGKPATYYDLIIDTGSSNTWIGANKTYTPTSTSSKTINSFTLRYGSGSVKGAVYNDQVTLSDDLVITKQGLGVADPGTAEGFDGVDGILGVGPQGLTRGTLFPGIFSTLPTVTDNLFSQKTIPSNALGIYFQPTTEEVAVNGELTFGGVDTSKVKGDIAYVPLTTKSPASAYWGVDQSLNYGNTQILSGTSGIVDTGTTLIYLKTAAYKAYLSATGGAEDKATGLIKIPQDKLASLQSLFFNIGSNKFELTANAQIWPRSLNEFIGGEANATYAVVADIGQVGAGIDFINGYTFLERYYTVYDTTNKRLGFGQTAYTFATSN
jgi:hypothetical protein